MVQGDQTADYQMKMCQNLGILEMFTGWKFKYTRDCVTLQYTHETVLHELRGHDNLTNSRSSYGTIHAAKGAAVSESGTNTDTKSMRTMCKGTTVLLLANSRQHERVTMMN